MFISVFYELGHVTVCSIHSWIFSFPPGCGAQDAILKLLAGVEPRNGDGKSRAPAPCQFQMLTGAHGHLESGLHFPSSLLVRCGHAHQSKAIIHTQRWQLPGSVLKGRSNAPRALLLSSPGNADRWLQFWQQAWTVRCPGNGGREGELENLGFESHSCQSLLLPPTDTAAPLPLNM